MRTCHICVPIVGPTPFEVQRQLAQASLLTNWVELRLDKWIQVDENAIGQLRQDYPQLSMIFTLRKQSQGGSFQGAEEKRFHLLFSLLGLRPEYVDIEADTPSSVIERMQRLSPHTKWIVSWHDFQSTPLDLEAIFEDLSAIPADYYKIVTKANSVCDSLRMLCFAKAVNADRSILCALCLGEEGQCTRILSPIVGNPFTFAALCQGLESASGQLTIHALLDTYHFKKLNCQTMVLGLIGNPVDKSMSDLTHNFVLDSLEINGVYVKFQLIPEELETFFIHIVSLNLKGLSVTMPYKEAVLKFLSSLDTELAAIGACNTIKCEGQILLGCNTDGLGALQAIKLRDLTHKKMVILGAGGTAKAIAFEAHKRGAHLAILNRTPDKAQHLASSLNAYVGAISDFKRLSQEGFDLLIQTTPIGMLPHVNEVPVFIEHIPSKAVVLDAISNPIETKLLKESRLKGCQCISGLEMFIHQAVLQFAYWFGEHIDQKRVEQAIRFHLPAFGEPGISVYKSQLKGHLSLPSSKSHSIRAILLGAMTHGLSKIEKVLDSPDIKQAIQAARLFGAMITENQDTLLIQGVNGRPHAPDNVIDTGNSGQVLRFASALAALGNHYTVFTGDESIRSNRSIQPLLEGLKGLGAFAESTRQNGYAPLIIKGPLQPGETSLRGEDSQPVSGLLMASAFVEGKTTIHVHHPGEKPWVALTLAWLDRLGVSYTNMNCETFTILGKQSYPAFHYIVPGDFSSAAFPLAAALITQSEMTIDNVDMDDIQGDKLIIPLLQQMGAHIDIDHVGRRLYVKRGSQLKGQTIDLNLLIDAVVILAVLACFAEGETRLINGAIARRKECDRLTCIAQELKKMGANIEEKDDGLLIRHSPLKGAIVKSYKDHRMALSLIVAGLGAEGVTRVEDIECIQKSYPSFIQDLRSLGAILEE